MDKLRLKQIKKEIRNETPYEALSQKIALMTDIITLDFQDLTHEIEFQTKQFTKFCKSLNQVLHGDLMEEKIEQEALETALDNHDCTRSPEDSCVCEYSY